MREDRESVKPFRRAPETSTAETQRRRGDRVIGSSGDREQSQFAENTLLAVNSARDWPTAEGRQPIADSYMSGRITKTVIRGLDAVEKRLRRKRTKTPEHLTIGRFGEEEAYFYLRRSGYVIVARNFRSPRRRGEIDLIGWDGEILCFIEVKTRTTREVMPAEAAVDMPKQQEVAAVAREYLRRMPAAPAYRFDIVTVYCEKAGQSPDITLYKNAFRLTYNGC
jgi:putative endonuclease